MDLKYALGDQLGGNELEEAAPYTQWPRLMRQILGTSLLVSWICCTCTYIWGSIFFAVDAIGSLEGLQYSLYDVGNVWSHFLEISSGLSGPQDAVCAQRDAEPCAAWCFSVFVPTMPHSVQPDQLQSCTIVLIEFYVNCLLRCRWISPRYFGSSLSPRRPFLAVVHVWLLASSASEISSPCCVQVFFPLAFLTPKSLSCAFAPRWLVLDVFRVCTTDCFRRRGCCG